MMPQVRLPSHQLRALAAHARDKALYHEGARDAARTPTRAREHNDQAVDWYRAEGRLIEAAAKGAE